MNQFIKYLQAKLNLSNCFNLHRRKLAGPFRPQGNLPFVREKRKNKEIIPVIPEQEILPPQQDIQQPEPVEAVPVQPQQPQMAPVAPVQPVEPEVDLDKFKEEVKNYLLKNKYLLDQYKKDADFILKIRRGKDPVERQNRDIMENTMAPPDRSLYEQMGGEAIPGNALLNNKFIKVFNAFNNLPEVFNKDKGVLQQNLGGYQMLLVLKEKTKAYIADSIRVEQDRLRERTTQLSPEQIQEQSRIYTRPVTKDKPADPYAVSIVHPDPDLSSLFLNKIDPKNLSEEQIDMLSKALRRDFRRLFITKPTIFSDAAVRMFGSPAKTRYFDQRMNFFIANPELLPPIPSKLYTIINDELERLGIEGELGDGLDDINSMLQNLQGIGRRKSRLLRIFNNEIAPSLYEIMKNLINNPGQPIPDIRILNWFGRGVQSAEINEKRSKEFKFDAPTGGEGEGAHKDIMDVEKGRTVDLSEDDTTPEQKIEIGKQIGAIVRASLEKTLVGMEEIKTKTVDQLLSDSVVDYKRSSEGLRDAQGNFERSARGLILKDKAGKIRALRNYNTAEILYAFCNKALPQLRNLFHFPKNVNVAGGDANYENIYGKVTVPRSTLKDIFTTARLTTDKVTGDKDDDYIRDVEHYTDLTNDDLVDHPFYPKWGDMVNSRIVGDAILDVVKLKTFIRSNANQNVSNGDYRGLIEKINKDPELANSLKMMGGNNPTNFIFMTLEQKQEDIDVLNFNKEKVIVHKQDERRYRQLKTQLIGDKWHAILPNIIQNVGAVGKSDYPDQAVQGFISLFDHQPKKIRNMSWGYRQVPEGEDECYTGLYYEALGETTPSFIEKLLEFRRKSIEIRERKQRKTLRQPMPGKTPQEKRSGEKFWWNEFFKEYDKFVIDGSYIDEQEAEVPVIKEKYSELEKVYRNRATVYISQIKEVQDSFKQTRFILKKFEENKKIVPAPDKLSTQKEIKDYQKALNFDNFVNFVKTWDGSSQDNYYYYQLLGVRKASNLYNVDKEIKFLNDKPAEGKRDQWGIEALKKDQNEVKNKMKQMFKDNNVDSSWIDALKIGYILYKRMKYAISLLQSTRNNMLKLSCNTQTTDNLIRDIEEYYSGKINNLFN